jgi:DNA-binding NarL/FixJ family response regulator
MGVVERYEGLEATAANLRRLLGEEGARRLVDAFGGRRLYVPKCPGAHHPITVAVGQDAADQLAAAFHGVAIDVPMLPETRTEIRRLDAEGLTRAAIARKLGVTERWVYMALAAPDKSDSRTPDLFD